MKTTKTFENATLRTVNNGYIELDYNGKTHCFNNASVVSVNNGSISIEIDWKPEKGELIKITGNCIDSYSIFDSICEDVMKIFGYKRINGTGNKLQNNFWWIGSETKISPVTPEEQQAFDDFCKSKGKIWNKEKLQWENYRWSPKPNEQYWYIASWGEIQYRYYKDMPIDQDFLRLGNAFPTKEQAEIIAEKVKELFKSL